MFGYYLIQSLESDIIETVFTVAFLIFFIIKLHEVKSSSTEVGILYTQKN